MSQKFDVIVVRKQALAEHYAAHLWKKHVGCDILATPDTTTLNDEQLGTIRGKNVLIVGGYYRHCMKHIVEAATTVCILICESEPEPEVVQHGGKLTILKFPTYSGVLTWSAERLAITDEVVLKVCEYLDEYIYGHPSETTLRFQNGIYTAPEADLDVVIAIHTNEDVEKIVLLGTDKRFANLRAATQRLNAAKLKIITAGDKSYSALVSIGDSPIIDTCLLLAENAPDGLGILFRYDIKTKKTFVSARATKESGINVGKFMAEWIGGGGSQMMGGGSIPKLVFPEELISWVNIVKQQQQGAQ